MSQKNRKTGLISTNFYRDYSATSMANSFVTLSTAALSESIDSARIFDSSGEPVWLAWSNTTASSSATTTSQAMLIPPGGIDGEQSLSIPLGSSLFIKTLSATATSGHFIITLFKEHS